MEINKTISLLDSLRDKQSKKSELNDQTQKNKTPLKSETSGDNTIIQISDYFHLRAKQEKQQLKDNVIKIQDFELAKETLDKTKLQVTEDPKQIFTAQANSLPITIFKLLS